ncbi:MAG: hypothetical protein ABII13_05335 [Patescibacteria group bacterium]
MRALKGLSTRILVIIIIGVLSAVACAILWRISINKHTTSQMRIDQQSTTAPNGWRIFKSSAFNCSIKLPNDWMLENPYFGSLDDLNEDIFNGDPMYGFLTTVSSPDRKEVVAFMTGPLETYGYECEVKILGINKLKVKEVNCPGSSDDVVPGLINYEFIDKNLVLVSNGKSVTIDKILKLIEFN